jgi:hypothetical protein
MNPYGGIYQYPASNRPPLCHDMSPYRDTTSKFTGSPITHQVTTSKIIIALRQEQHTQEIVIYENLIPGLSFNLSKVKFSYFPFFEVIVVIRVYVLRLESGYPGHAYTG